ncbi:MAG: efflux RND transporter periplasmic adaptor subunit [Clostridiales bacterium]|nr:efflux RND transporter periplasmic adaptor subunit [Clostridiales bacterium]
MDKKPEQQKQDQAAMHDNTEQAKAKKGKGSKIRRILFPLLLILVAAGCSVAYYFYSAGSNYFTTDNAKVTAQMYSVAALSSGKLLAWDINVGDYVSQDQILGRQEVLPYITAPISGIVVKNDGVVQQMAAAGTPLAIIADTQNLYIGVNVEETDISKIRLGQIVDISIDAYPKRIFYGQVSEINQTTQTYFSGMSSFSTSGTYTKVTQLIPIKVTIDNSDNLPLAFGMNATVKIYLK